MLYKKITSILFILLAQAFAIKLCGQDNPQVQNVFINDDAQGQTATRHCRIHRVVRRARCLSNAPNCCADLVEERQVARSRHRRVR